MSEQADTLLQQLVFGENQCISYRLLSRLLNVDVNSAKKYLTTFYEKNSSLDASYIVIGIEKVEHESSSISGEDANHDRAPVTHEAVTEKLALRIYGKDQIEGAKKKFSPLRSVHIYSIAQSGANDPTNLTSVDLKTQQNDMTRPIGEASSVLGLLRNPELPEEILTKTQVSEQKSKQKLRAASETAKKPSAPSTSTTKESSFANFFNKPDTTSKKSTKKPVKPKISSIEAAFARAKAPPKEPEEKVVVEKHNAPDKDAVVEEEPVETSEEIEKRKQNRENLQKIFDNDDVDMKDEENNDDQKPPGSPDWDVDMDDDVVEVENPDKENPPPVQPTEELLPGAPPGRRRGRRKVPKRVTKVDSNGYLVTKLEDAWESFSEDEPQSESKPISKPAAEPVKKAGSINPSTIQSIPERNMSKKDKAKQNQTSLFSFFKK